MSQRTILLVAVTVVLLAAGGYAAFQFGMQRGSALTDTSNTARTATADAPAIAPIDPSGWSIPQGEEATRRHIREGLAAGTVDPVTGKKILYYHDPMVPGNKFDRPAKSPFMAMMLVPVYAGVEGADAGGVSVSSRIQQNLGIRTADVSEGVLATEFTTVGSIVWNERDQAIVQARATGFVERVFARATLDRVAAGQPLVELYVPEWVAAQEEFLALRRMTGSDLAPLVDAARARMRQAGMDEAQIARVEAAGAVQASITLRAPIGGVLTEVMAREGMTVMSGATLFRINGTGTVWAQAEVPESQAALLRPGASVRATSPAVPGEIFEGRVQALLPEVNATTRTIKARLELANRTGRLVPGMFVQMQFMDKLSGKTLLVPTEAVIQTGKRAVVMLAEADGHFRPVDVVTGIEGNGQTQILSGLKAGQRVVVSSQFLIDSEASLKGLESRLNVEAPGPVSHTTQALIEALQGDRVTLSHPPIPSLKWPEMTMEFKLPPASKQSRGLAAGERVDIEFSVQENDVPQITRMTRVGPDTATPGTAKGSKP